MSIINKIKYNREISTIESKMDNVKENIGNIKQKANKVQQKVKKTKKNVQKLKKQKENIIIKDKNAEEAADYLKKFLNKGK